MLRAGFVLNGGLLTGGFLLVAVMATSASAGMSQDLEAAIAFGATHLRIGSDILGSRPAVG